MHFQEAEIVVLGGEQPCAGCANLPTSRETFEWLKAAIARKFPNQPFKIVYIDVFDSSNIEEFPDIIRKIIEGEMFYPVVLIGGKIVGEGNPKLKTIFEEMDKYGYNRA